MPDVRTSTARPIVTGSAPLLIAGAAVVAVGLATRRRDLTVGGIRLAAVPFATAMIGTAFRRFGTADHAAAAPPPLVVQAMAAWLAEALVSAALARLDPAGGRVVEG